MRVRKGDIVYVRIGQYKGKTGKVLFVDTKKQTVIIQGINMRKRHQKPSQKNPQGGVITMEAPVHISNIALYSSTLSGPTKVSTKIIHEGTKATKVRICRKTGEQI
ncbi:MAG: 50S ribosomal protein L24 [FCB group bacterium]|nr:50S ribosomal protein L24 [FCB group bacterium]